MLDEGNESITRVYTLAIEINLDNVPDDGINIEIVDPIYNLNVISNLSASNPIVVVDQLDFLR